MALHARTGLDQLFAKELELCGVAEGQTVGVLTQGRKRIAYADAVMRACTELGAAVFAVDIPSDGAPDDGGPLGVRAGHTGLGTFPPLLVPTFQSCDLMVDLVFLLWSPEQAAIRAAGTRVLSCVEHPQALKRMFPDAALKDRVLAARELLEAASEMRITSDAGTDVVYQLGQYGYIHQYGMADEPGRWDHFASALVGTVGRDDGVDGTVVLAPGDLIFPHERYVDVPVRIRIESGRVTAIDGGADAMLVRDYLEQSGDDDAYAISHIGWGMSPHARWDTFATAQWDAQSSGTRGIGMESRCFNGSVMFSTGPNVEFGGANATRATSTSRCGV